MQCMRTTGYWLLTTDNFYPGCWRLAAARKSFCFRYDFVSRFASIICSTFFAKSLILREGVGGGAVFSFNCGMVERAFRDCVATGNEFWRWNKTIKIRWQPRSGGIGG